MIIGVSVLGDEIDCLRSVEGIELKAQNKPLELRSYQTWFRSADGNRPEAVAHPIHLIAPLLLHRSFACVGESRSAWFIGGYSPSITLISGSAPGTALQAMLSHATLRALSDGSAPCALDCQPPRRKV